MSLITKDSTTNESPFQRQLRRAMETDEKLHKEQLAESEALPADKPNDAEKAHGAAGSRLRSAAGHVKTAAVSAAAAAAVTAALVSPQPDAPDENPYASALNPAPIVFTVNANGDTVPDDGADEEKKRSPRAFTAFIQKALPAFKSIAGFTAAAALHFLSFLLTSFLTALTGGVGAGLIGFLGDLLVSFILLFAVLSWLFKKLYPGRSLKELWTIKNLGLLLCFSAAIALAKRLILLLPTEQRALAVVIETVAKLLLVSYCTLTVLVRRGGRKTFVGKALRSRPVRRAALVYTGWTVFLCCFRLVAFQSGTAAAYGGTLLLFGLAAGLAYAAVRLRRRAAA